MARAAGETQMVNSARLLRAGRAHRGAAHGAQPDRARGAKPRAVSAEDMRAYLEANARIARTIPGNRRYSGALAAEAEEHYQDLGRLGTPASRSRRENDSPPPAPAKATTTYSKPAAT